MGPDSPHTLEVPGQGNGSPPHRLPGQAPLPGLGRGWGVQASLTVHL